MFYTIGEAAGEIWGLLNDAGPLSVSTIAQRMKRPQTTIHMGIGWLAREDKLEFKQNKGGVSVSLKK
ncbi:winged helix-turn-helix domain-containing protein [Chloroflexota bacterium]